MNTLPSDTGIIIVDHGSTVDEANQMLLQVAQAFQETTGASIVEAAHMELAEPTLQQAFDRCVEQGAVRVVVHPYFLAPGRHSTTDIPRLAKEAAARHPGITVRISEPLGADPGMHAIMLRRIQEALDKTES